jgi:hypothetical protein
MNQMRSDSEQLQLQYQQYSFNMQRHAQELNDQVWIIPYVNLSSHIEIIFFSEL